MCVNPGAISDFSRSGYGRESVHVKNTPLMRYVAKVPMPRIPPMRFMGVYTGAIMVCQLECIFRA